MSKSIVIGADHGGYAMKEELKAYLATLNQECIDVGTHNGDRVCEGGVGCGVTLGGKVGLTRGCIRP
jgi:hypothetical protein